METIGNIDPIASDATIAPSESSPASRAAQSFPKIDGYRITGILGGGGQAVVYFALETKLDERPVALKVFPTMANNAKAAQRTLTEVTAAARLQYAHIVPIFSFGESNGAYYYAMEPQSGPTLNKLIEGFSEERTEIAAENRSTMGHSASSASLRSVDDGLQAPASFRCPSPHKNGRAYYRQVAQWMADAADALHYAHGEGVVHRDIKPGNLILAKDGRIMVTDFGLATSSRRPSPTSPGELEGTIPYMSPEQAMAQHIPLDHRTDVFSLGATLYELLCLKLPFPGTDPESVLEAVITKNPTPPKEIVHAVPRDLQKICLKVLEKAKDRRFGTAHEMANALRAYLTDRPVPPAGPLDRAFKFAKRNRAMVSVGGAALILFVTFLGFVRARAHWRAMEFEHLMVEAGDAQEKRQWHVAEQRYHAALDYSPRDPLIYGNLAIIKKEEFNEMKEPDDRLLIEAVDLLHKAISIDSSLTRCWNTLGVVFKKQGNFAEAANAYDRAIKLDPSDPLAWSNYAAMKALLRDLDSAEKSLHRAVENASVFNNSAPDPGARFCHPWRDLAMLQLLRGDSSALTNIDLAIACVGDSETRIFSNIVSARIRLTLPGFIELDTAIRNAQFADDLSNKKSPLAKRYLALAYLRTNKLSAAIEEARKAIELGDNWPCMDHLIIAVAERGAGHSDAVKAALQAAESTWPVELKEPGSYIPSAPKGFLWFETARQLIELRDAAQ